MSHLIVQATQRVLPLSETLSVQNCSSYGYGAVAQPATKRQRTSRMMVLLDGTNILNQSFAKNYSPFGRMG